MIDYLEGLNERQREAVLHIDGPIMIVAGAGSGKTKVLTTRVIHLMANGVDSRNTSGTGFPNARSSDSPKRLMRTSLYS